MTNASRYSSLRTIARIFRLMAWIVAVLGGLTVLGAAINAGQVGPGRALFVLLFGALVVALYALTFFAASEFIHLMIDVEANTRRTADALGASPPPPGA